MKAIILGMKYRSLFKHLYLIGACLFSGCSKTENSDALNVPEVIKIQRSAQSPTFYYRDLIEDVKFISLSTECPFLVNVKKVLIHQDRIIVFDNKDSKIALFDSSGEFLNLVGKRGQGPGEFIRINDVTINKNNRNILAICDERKSLMSFDFDGKYIEEKRLNYFVNQIELIGHEDVLIFNDYPSDDPFSVRWLESKGTVKDNLFPFSKDIKDMRFDFNGGLSDNEDGVLFNHSSQNIFYQIKESGEVYSKFYVDFGSRKWAKDKELDITGFHATLFGGEISYLVNDFYESEDQLVFTYVEQMRMNKAFFNKRTKAILTTRNIHETRFSEYLNASNFVGRTSDGYFILSLDPENIIMFSEEQKDSSIEFDELTPLANDMSLESNPILIFMKLKS